MQARTPKYQRGTHTIESFRMLNFDDFMSYSSYTTKIYMKNLGGSAQNSIVEKLAFLESKCPPGDVIFSMVEVFSNCVFLVMGTHMHTEYIASSRNLDKQLVVPLWTKGPL